jgi:hypothetical protein
MVLSKNVTICEFLNKTFNRKKRTLKIVEWEMNPQPFSHLCPHFWDLLQGSEIAVRDPSEPHDSELWARRT